MAQYYEVLSQSDGNLDQPQPFFNGSQENERTQVRYLIADESSQFQAQQLLVSGDQVMVLDNSQAQIQRVVIDQPQTFHTVNQQQQFGNIVQSAATMNNQQAQQIFFMETNSNQSGETIQPLSAAVIEQGGIQTSQTASQPQPIVLNHQLSTNNTNVANRQVLQGTQSQRSTLQIRTAVRQAHVQINQQQPRVHGNPARPGLPQQVRAHQSPPVQMRNLPQQPQVQMRIRNTPPQVRQPLLVQQQQPGIRSANMTTAQLAHAKTQMSRQLAALQQKQQQVVQNVAQQQQQQQQPPHPQQSQQQQPQQQIIPQQPVTQQATTAAHMLPRSLNEYQQRQQRPQIKAVQEEELDDHDPTMNSNPGQMANYKKLLEQRQQIGKNPILARLPSNIKITTGASSAHQQTSPSQTQPQCSIAQTIDQVVNQVTQQHQQQLLNQSPMAGQNVQSPQKKPRAPAKPRNSTPRQPANRQRVPRMPAVTQQQQFTRPQQPGAPRFPINQPPQRFANQQQMMQQQPRAQLQQQPQQQQPPNPPQQQHVQQNGMPLSQPSQLDMSHQQGNGSQPQTNQSQMNYLITPPTPNRPRQQHPLPPYIPSSQIQQIIGMFQENTPIADEFSDSIRMLVLLENGEQRLITFTLPKEACTIQEILEQVCVPFTPETNIQVTEANTSGINYIVTVGNVATIGGSAGEDESHESVNNSIEPQQQVNQQQSIGGSNNFAPKPLAPEVPAPPPEPPKPPSPPPKLIPGKLAVCSYCGYTGEDFNKCTRCLRKLPENARAIEVSEDGMDFKPSNDSMKSSPISSIPKSTSGKSEQVAKTASPVKKKVVKPKHVDNESVVISSDEEEDDKAPVKSVSEQLLDKLGASISISPVTKEPSVNEIKKHVRKLSIETTKLIKIPLKCRTVRIGSYRFVPIDDVILESKCVIVKAPVVDNKSEVKTIRIDRGDIVKVLICYDEVLPVIFYYLNVGAAPIIRDMLNLTRESGYYFDPIEEKKDSFRKITLMPDDNLEELKSYFQQLYGVPPHNTFEELTPKEANDILLKSFPKESNSSNIGHMPSSRVFNMNIVRPRSPSGGA